MGELREGHFISGGEGGQKEHHSLERYIVCFRQGRQHFNFIINCELVLVLSWGRLSL
jgi:hypothetical protein